LDKKPRADSLRNREHILNIAREAFTTSGASISLDDIAKKANVGPGTLYRHFPNREALLEAVYRSEVAKLCAAEKEFATTMSAVEALRAWMLLFIDYIDAKLVISSALNLYLCAESSELFETTGNQIKAAIRGLVERAVQTGDIRDDVDPLDLLRAIFGIANTASSADWHQSARKLVDILILGSKPQK
jgi:AcrR family transcriptional regulator